VTFAVGQGEILGFLGPNGAGKSTTMRMLTGLVRPSEGTARLGGFDVHRENDRVRRMLGYLPEQSPLYPEMTVAGFLEFMGGIKGMDGRERRREMERTTALLNLVRERGRLLRNLSKGTRQRVGIANALIGRPPVLLLDEPTVGLDPAQINDVREIVRSLRGKATVVLSTHILSEIEATATRIVIIANGAVVAQGTPEELRARVPPRVRVRVCGDRPALDGALLAAGITGAAVTELGGQLQVMAGALDEKARATLAREVVTRGLDLVELHEEQARLEDVFLTAVGRRAT
jgi:ABC-2 type transport system ATP-binding protein